MALGLSAVNLADKWLNVLGNGASAGTTFTALPGTFIKLHTGDPGSAGATAAAAGSTTRVAQGFSAAASGSKASTGTAPVWTNGGTAETLSHISAWDAATAGNFIFSAALTSTQAWASGNTFTLTALSITLTPIAA